MKRCRAGFDNWAACTFLFHTDMWHSPQQAKDDHLGYGYDQCRREAGHEKDKSLPYHDVHLPDCGGAVYDDGESDFTDAWVHIYDIVKSSGERLDWPY